REGRPAEAVARLEVALEALGGEEADEDTATVAAQLGRFLVLDNQFDDALPRLELALGLAEALGLREVIAQPLASKSTMYTGRNRLEQARILLEGALDFSLENDLHPAALRAFNNLAVNHESQDRYRDAVDTSGRGLELAHRVGDRVWEEICLYGPISALVMIGEWDEALARAASAEHDAVITVGQLTLPAGLVECARGDIAAARRRVDELASLATSDDPQAKAHYTVSRAQVLRAEGRLSDALASAEAAIEVKWD